MDALQGLRPDPQTTTNALLLALLRSQSSTLVTFQPPVFTISLSSKVINIVWFSSLSFSLVSALGASLAKGWIAEYAQIPHKPNAVDAYLRHTRYVGISHWHMADFVTALPIFLHISVLLFAMGLVIRLLGDFVPLGILTLVITAATTLLYFGTVLVPMIRQDCPYQSPITPILSRIVRTLSGNGKQPDPERLSDADKAKMFFWLHETCRSSSDIDQVVTAFAGLDMPHISGHTLIHNTRFAKAVKRRLLAQLGERIANTDSDKIDTLNAHLYALSNTLCHDVSTTNEGKIAKDVISETVKVLTHELWRVQQAGLNVIKRLYNKGIYPCYLLCDFAIQRLSRLHQKAT